MNLSSKTHFVFKKRMFVCLFVLRNNSFECFHWIPIKTNGAVWIVLLCTRNVRGNTDWLPKQNANPPLGLCWANHTLPRGGRCSNLAVCLLPRRYISECRMPSNIADANNKTSQKIFLSAEEKGDGAAPPALSSRVDSPPSPFPSVFIEKKMVESKVLPQICHKKSLGTRPVTFKMWTGSIHGRISFYTTPYSLSVHCTHCICRLFIVLTVFADCSLYALYLVTVHCTHRSFVVC